MLGSIIPIADAADAADGNAHVLRDGREQVQGDGLHGRAAIAAMRGFAADVRPRRKVLEIDAHQGVDRVDQADGVGAAALGGQRRCGVMLVTLGVSLTITGILAASFTQDVIISVYSGTWPTAAPMPRSLMP